MSNEIKSDLIPKGCYCRKVSPDNVIMWSYDAGERMWCATVHTNDGDQVGEGSYETNKYDAIIQAMRGIA